MTGLGVMLSSGVVNAELAPRVAIEDTTVNSIQTNPDDAWSGYRLGADGKIYTSTGTDSTLTEVGTWLLSGVVADYEVFATINSGTLSNGTDVDTGSWLSMSGNRTWRRNMAVVGSQTATLTVQLRDASTLEVLDTMNLTLYAEVLA